MTCQFSSALTLDPAAVASLRQQLRGPLLHVDDPGYDGARRVFNAMIDRHPALIARPANAEDIRHAVLFAREHGLLLAVKGGGHPIADTVNVSAFETVSQVALQLEPLLLAATIPFNCLEHFTDVGEGHGVFVPYPRD